MNITIYTKSNCPNCVSAKQLLKSKGLEYQEYWVDANPIAEQQMRDSGLRQMPQIFYKGERIGGLAGLQAWLKWKEEQ